MNMPTTLVILALAIIMTAKFNDGSAIETLDPQERQADDGCRGAEWRGFHGVCYHLAHTRRLNYGNAVTECKAMDATLATIHNEDEQQFLAGLMEIVPDAPYFGYFIGLTKVYGSTWSVFVWNDGTKLVYNSWAPNKPNNKNGKQDCVIMWADQGGQWNDYWCSSKKAYICQKPTDV